MDKNGSEIIKTYKSMDKCIFVINGAVFLILVCLTCLLDLIATFLGCYIDYSGSKQINKKRVRFSSEFKRNGSHLLITTQQIITVQQIDIVKSHHILIQNLISFSSCKMILENVFLST